MLIPIEPTRHALTDYEMQMSAASQVWPRVPHYASLVNIIIIG